jgi:hypothetical protein
MNWMVIPTLALAFGLFGAGAWLWPRVHGRIARSLLLMSAIAFTVPSILFVAYYLHLFDNAAWFYQLRSLPLSELVAGGAGLLAGILSSVAQKRELVSRTLLLALLTLGIVGPHLKPIVAPLPASCFQDRWSDGVCLQSTSSSCGAASAATLLRACGLGATEAEIARRCFTSLGGTENWYLARFIRRQGFVVRMITGLGSAERIPVPCIAGVRIGGAGHFIPVIAESATMYVTGDPLVGRQEWPKDRLRQQFGFTGFFMVVRKTQ